MKKPSVNLDGLKQFFIRHGEKFAFGAIVVVLFLPMVYRSLTRESLDWGPDRLADAASQADQKMTENRKVVAVDVPDIMAKARRLETPIPADPYRSIVNWKPALFPERKLRDQPALFAVESLRGTTGFGSVRMQGGTQGKRWVSLVGLLPLGKQRQAHAEKFSEAKIQRGALDAPAYAGYYIERAVEEAGSRSGEPKWESLPVSGIYAVVRQYSGSSPEVVASQYLARPVISGFQMHFPLPPVDNHTFGADAAHEPEIPVTATTTVAAAMPGAAPTTSNPLEDTTAVPPGFETSGGEEEEEEEGAAAPAATSTADQVEYQLFRFLDYNVEPGKQYRYRVRLALLNPNYNLSPRYLSSEALAKERYIMSEWSEPSSPVVVPPDSRVILAAVSPATGVASEPKGRIVGVQFDQATGVEASEEFDVYRGQVANFLDREKKVVGGNPAELAVEPTEEVDPTTGAKKPVTPRKKPPERIHFLTEMLVLDLRGGQRLPGKDRTMVEPGLMLLLDPSGRMVMRNELDDQDAYMLYKPPVVVKPPREDRNAPSDDEGDAFEET